MNSAKDKNQIIFTLSEEEALVLLDGLCRLNQKENNTFLNPTEQQLLWDMESELEKHLSATFSANYREILAEAKKKINQEK